MVNMVRGLFEHKRLKAAIIITSQGDISFFTLIQTSVNICIKVDT